MNFTGGYLQEARELIVSTVRERRDELVKLHGSAKFTVKSDNTVVTTLDGELETALRSALGAFDGSIGLTGEEGGVIGSETTRWILDPIDGTEQFIRGLPGCLTMASFVVDDKPAMVVIYDFINDITYHAVSGGGAFQDGIPVHVSDRPLDRAWVEVSNLQKMVDNGVFESLSMVVEIVRFRNPVINVPTGKLDGYVVVNGGGGPWDYIPRALMVKEAGGRVANFGSDSYDYRNTSFLGTNPFIFEPIKEIVESRIS